MKTYTDISLRKVRWYTQLKWGRQYFSSVKNEDEEPKRSENVVAEDKTIKYITIGTTGKRGFIMAEKNLLLIFLFSRRFHQTASIVMIQAVQKLQFMEVQTRARISSQSWKACNSWIFSQKRVSK